MFAKQSLMSLVAGFFLFGLMLTANRSEAQGVWKQPADAQQALATAIKTQLYPTMASNAPGSAQYIDAAMHVYYYKAIHTRINEGMSVADAVSQSLNIFPEKTGSGVSSGANYPEIPVQVDKTKRQILLADATTLLQ